MAENQKAKVAVASHGLHKHSYNYPWLSSLNFCDVMPCYINTLRKGEKDNPQAGMFSQLMPVVHNAFATGRYNFKAIFVPFKLVWRPYYSFAEQVEFVSDGKVSLPNQYPFVTDQSLSQAFYTGYTDAAADSTDYDIVFRSGNTRVYRTVKPAGRPILRILGALGCMPSFDLDNHDTTINILPLMCYIKAFMDYYFPNQYVGNQDYNQLAFFVERDTIDFSSNVSGLLGALAVASVGYYDNSVFDNAWDHPAAPNQLGYVPSVSIKDATDPDNDIVDVVDNTTFASGTPVMVNNQGDPVFSQYIVNSLKSLSMWMKRHQLAGVRLLDRFLVSRGIALSEDSARMSGFLGQRNIEINVQAVENNSNTNLGELAGRGVASSGNEPLKFKCVAQDDGILLVIVHAVPDANFPIYLDGFSARKDFMDSYHAEFDKLGAAAVPSRVVASTLNGYNNAVFHDNVFGFLSQYWDEVQERPRLLGDFILRTQGAGELSAYHTFRASPLDIFSTHSYNFVRSDDKAQYQRLFYSESQENFMLFLRWYGQQYKEKLPLGDSYDWDDDELNRKVDIVVAGAQK